MDFYQEGYTIFVKNIPYSTNAQELSQVFLQFGEVLQSHIATTKERGKIKSRGYGFVTFKTQESYNKAINNKTPIKIKGDRREFILEVSPAKSARPNDTIYIENFPETTREENIREAFRGFNISQISIPQPRGPTPNRKHFAFIKFGSTDDYDRAIALQYVTIKGIQIKISPEKRANNNYNNNNNFNINNNTNNDNNNDNNDNDNRRFPRRGGFRGRDGRGRGGRGRGRHNPYITQNQENDLESYEIFVGNIPSGASKENVMKSLFDYNPINIVQFGQFYGGNFAIVKLKSKEDSMKAISQKVSINNVNCNVLLAKYNQRKTYHGIRRAPRK